VEKIGNPESPETHPPAFSTAALGLNVDKVVDVSVNLLDA
jgi:hypothetical protein